LHEKNGNFGDKIEFKIGILDLISIIFAIIPTGDVTRILPRVGGGELGRRMVKI